MTWKSKLSLIVVLLASSFQAPGQGFRYYRELAGITDQWHAVELPDEVFPQVTSNLSDIRIMGVTEEGDTVEAPYMLRVNRRRNNAREIDFELINESRNEEGFYYSFEVASLEAINRIKLNLGQNNFDWRVSLEGSQDQLEWFTLLADYRILAITNPSTDYRFTLLNFGEAKYRYLRLFIKSQEQPQLESAQLELQEILDGKTRDYSLSNWGVEENTESRQTVIDMQLPLAVPVSSIELTIEEDIDYQRRIRIQYLADSIRTDKRWRYQYQELDNGTLSSLEDPRFEFQQVITDRIRVVIFNLDNEPLTVRPEKVSGYVHTLVARFTKPATYYLVYGNSSARPPQYDISQFSSRIPEELTNLLLGNEEELERLSEEVGPLFNSQLWLWAMLILIIGVLGWFTIRMMKNG